MSGPIKRIRIPGSLEYEPIPRRPPAFVRWLEGLLEFGGELLEALALGFRAGSWFALVIVAFAAAFLGIAAIVYLVAAWIVSRAGV